MNLLEEAIIYSTIMHQGKVRKIRKTPFILHPLEVAQIISTMTDDQEVIAAGVLHDIVEDTDGTLNEIRKRFGDRVAMLVDSESEPDFPGEDRAATWKKRKEASLQVLRSSKDIGVKMLWLADKLANIRSFDSTYREHGDKLWEFLHQKDPSGQLWYYQTVAEYVEMDLNKTGAYKEFIGHINFIWPGTFSSEKAKYKKYRSVSIDGCALIGRGAKGDIYRYTDELIVKVYNDKNTYKDVERELSLARTAFVMGLPTAISFGIVSVGNRYGALFELLETTTVSRLIAKNPEHVEYYAGLVANLAREIHNTEAKDETTFPEASVQLLRWVKRGLDNEDMELSERLQQWVLSFPKTRHLVHGDFHTGNVLIQNGEPLFIDVDGMSMGDPIVDLSSMYLFYVGYGELDPSMIENYMGFSYETSKAFYHHFIRSYLQSEDEKQINEVTQKASLLAYVRYLSQIAKKTALTEEDRHAKDYLLSKIRKLAGLVALQPKDM